jgi:hypothetical protein
LAKNGVFLKKNNVMIIFFAKTSIVLCKTCQFFDENIFKIITSVPVEMPALVAERTGGHHLSGQRRQGLPEEDVAQEEVQGDALPGGYQVLVSRQLEVKLFFVKSTVLNLEVIFVIIKLL